mmetsp:Transcript_62330/g.171241  ORF Transcript_62330/g.171241 Transcript_62330/m.171241 type:complete len:453 (-) Transcript_62330:188-1546(-)
MTLHRSTRASSLLQGDEGAGRGELPHRPPRADVTDVVHLSRERREQASRRVEALGDLRGVRVLGRVGDDGLDREGTQRLADAHRALRRRATAREGNDVGRTAALHVDVDAADDGRERVDERGGGGGGGGEERGLLAVPRLLDRRRHLRDVVEARDGHDGPKLLLVEESHRGRHAIDDRRRHQRACDAAAARGLVGKRGALAQRVANELLEVLGLRCLGQRRDGDALLPRQAHLERANLCDEPLHERVGDARVHHDQLDRRAPLAVVARRPEHALRCRDVEVGVWQHNAQVLALELRKHLEAVRRRVRLDERVGAARAANEAEHVNQARLHDWPHRLAARAAHKVDNARRQHLLERRCRQHVDKATNGRQLEHRDVAHQERRDEHSVHLVERVVEWRQRQHHANRPTADAHAHAGHLAPLRKALANRRVLLELGDRCGDEVHRAIKLLGGVGR